MLILYNILLWIAAIFLTPWYAVRIMRTGKYRRGFGQRLGFLPPNILAGLIGRPRIWFHAESVYAVVAAAPIIAAIRKRLPGATIILSTTTDTGQEFACRIVTGANAFIYHPLDMRCAVSRAIEAVLPDIFVLTETELWPNFIHYCQTHGVKLMIANARAPRSTNRYLKMRFFGKGLLSAFSEIGVISRPDAQRFRRLGAPETKVKTCGNTRYEFMTSKSSEILLAEMRTRLRIAPGAMVLVAGNTHEGEEATVFDVYKEVLTFYPDCKLIIVPRHIERVSAVLRLARGKGFSDVVTMAEINGDSVRRDERVVIVDLIDELFKIYSLATVVFCGGSLVPKGGQNILEAAAWGKVVLYGPFMDDFKDEIMLLESAGAGIMVKDGDDLLARILKLMAHPAELVAMGEAGRRIVAANGGASDWYAELIIDCISRTVSEVTVQHS